MHIFVEWSVGLVGTSHGVHRHFGGSILTFAYFFYIWDIAAFFSFYFIELGVSLVVSCQGYKGCFWGSILTFAYFFSYFRNIKPFLHYCYKTIIWSSGYQTRLWPVFWGFNSHVCILFSYINKFHCLFCSTVKKSKLVPWLPTKAVVEIVGVQFLSATYFFSSGSYYFFSYFHILKLPFLPFFRLASWTSGYQPGLLSVFLGFDPHFAYFFHILK